MSKLEVTLNTVNALTLTMPILITFLKSSSIKKAEDTEADTAELTAIKLLAQKQVSNALVTNNLDFQMPVNIF